MNRKFLLKLHLWLSLPLGIIIMLICLSGATLVFKNEIRNALGMPKVVAPHGKSGKGGNDGKTASLQQEKSTASHQCSPNGCSQCPSKEVCHPSASAKDN
ncbi:PepSY domain-containing protein, partial [Prevotella sp.]|uniref:PepSY domain-containing protein n=1 Tax=Prevotella sp. TaxID=59823 RepID=UPI003FD8CFD2